MSSICEWPGVGTVARSYHVGKSRDEEAADQVGGPITSASAGRHHGSLTEVALGHTRLCES